MKVWTLHEVFQHEGSELLGIYSSEAKAKDAKSVAILEDPESYGWGQVPVSLEIEEWEVDRGRP